MELHPGVFVSSVSTNEWEADPDIGGEMHILCSGVGVDAGLSRFTDASTPVRWTPPDRETGLILEGAARIEIVGGPTLDLKAGDIFSLPKGVETTWYITLPFKEFWVIG